jgi:hypothetical protein
VLSAGTVVIGADTKQCTYTINYTQEIRRRQGCGMTFREKWRDGIRRAVVPESQTTFSIVRGLLDHRSSTEERNK